jgi:hypothetical protein
VRRAIGTFVRSSDGTAVPCNVQEGVVDRGSAAATNPSNFLQEKTMNRKSLIALAALFVSFAVQAADPATPAAKPIQPVAVAAPAAQKTAVISQQDRMRDCSKQATGKKGAERKAFMKTCLSKKKA